MMTDDSRMADDTPIDSTSPVDSTTPVDNPTPVDSIWLRKVRAFGTYAVDSIVALHSLRVISKPPPALFDILTGNIDNDIDDESTGIIILAVLHTAHENPEWFDRIIAETQALASTPNARAGQEMIRAWWK
jgi:hypothetical protein